MGPDDLKSIGVAIGMILSGAGGVIATQKLQKKVAGAPSNASEDTGSAILAEMQLLNEKMDRVESGHDVMKVRVKGLHQDVREVRMTQERISEELGQVVDRVGHIESRITKPIEGR